MVILVILHVHTQCITINMSDSTACTYDCVYIVFIQEIFVGGGGGDKKSGVILLQKTKLVLC